MHFEDKDKNKKEKNIAIKDIREMVKVSILWGGQPISCNKSFGKLNCYLCMHERINILKSIRKDEKTKVRRCINNNSEIYGSCRHKPKFHRYSNYLSSADDGRSPEKSEQVLTPSPPRKPLGEVTNNFLCRKVNSELAVGTDGGSNGKILVMDV